MLERLRSVIAGVEWPAVPGNAGGAMLSVLFQLEHSQWSSAAEQWPRQRRQLRALLAHAVQNCPYYGERIDTSVRSLAEEFSPADFSRLPLLTRSDVQQHFQELCAQRLPAGHGPTSHSATSGSTGEPVRFASTALSAFFWQAFMLREHLWHRRDLMAKMVVLRVEKEETRLSNWFGDLGKEVFETGPCIILPARWNFDRQLDRILEEQPAYLLGYASNVAGVLQTAEQRGIAMPWLREARMFGEAVSPEMRAYVRRQWKLPLTDVYTAREAGYLALQCPEHEVYHLQSESALVEVLDDHGRPCAPGEIGRVVVTRLHNFGMPLIRYDIGDYARVGEACACGRGLPVVERIMGRVRNVLHLPDGTKRWPTLGTSKLAQLAPIKRIRVIQKSLQEIEVRLVPLRPFHDTEIENLREHLIDQFGFRFEVRFVFLEEMPVQRSDKFEDFVSEIH